MGLSLTFLFCFILIIQVSQHVLVSNRASPPLCSSFSGFFSLLFVVLPNELYNQFVQLQEKSEDIFFFFALSYSEFEILSDQSLEECEKGSEVFRGHQHSPLSSSQPSELTVRSEIIGTALEEAYPFTIHGNMVLY